MDFSEKIDKILDSNSLGITSPTGLEEFVGAGRGAISTPYREKSAPGPKTQNKIVEKLRINKEWWKTGRGEVFIPDPSHHKAHILRDTDIIEAENYIGMHKRVYDSLEKSLTSFQELARQAQKNVNDLTQILANRSGPGSGPLQGS